MSKISTKIILLASIVLPLFFHHSNCFAFDNSDIEQFYIINLAWNSKENALNLSKNTLSPPVMVDMYNFTNDTGSGSQYYAQVKNSEGQIRIIKNQDRFYLGQWRLIEFWDKLDKGGKLTGGNKELEKGEIKVSVPYFPDGKNIEIYDVKNRELALTIDVSQFAKKDNQLVITNNENIPTNKVVANNLETGKKKSSSIVAIIILIVIVAAIAGAVYFFRKKYFNNEY